MLYQVLLGIIVCILSKIVVAASENVDDGYIVTLQHSVGNGEYFERAKLYFSSIRGERAVAQQAPFCKDENLLSEELLKQNNIYKVRIQSKLYPATSSSVINEALWLTSYTYAKFLKEINFNIDIVIHTDGLGNLIALNIAPSNDGSYLDLGECATNVTLVMPGLAPVPDTVGYLNKLEDERRKKEQAAKEPQTFFGKYWMYILPMVLFMMVQSAAQQPQQA